MANTENVAAPPSGPPNEDAVFCLHLSSLCLSTVCVYSIGRRVRSLGHLSAFYVDFHGNLVQCQEDFRLLVLALPGICQTLQGRDQTFRGITEN